MAMCKRCKTLRRNETVRAFTDGRREAICECAALLDGVGSSVNGTHRDMLRAIAAEIRKKALTGGVVHA